MSAYLKKCATQHCRYWLAQVRRAWRTRRASRHGNASVRYCIAQYRKWEAMT